MKPANPKLSAAIRKKTLSLLLEKEPSEISMREIASHCGVSAASLYYYYADKNALFEAVKIDCLTAMDRYIAKKLKDIRDPAAAIRTMHTAFRDWCFAYPRIALLVMDRFRANTEIGQEDAGLYYRSSLLAASLLDRAVAEGKSKSRDTRLDTSLCVAALWGAVQSVLLNRTLPEYWNKGKFFTNKMIDLCCDTLLVTDMKEKKNENTRH